MWGIFCKDTNRSNLNLNLNLVEGIDFKLWQVVIDNSTLAKTWKAISFVDYLVHHWHDSVINPSTTEYNQLQRPCKTNHQINIHLDEDIPCCILISMFVFQRLIVTFVIKVKCHDHLAPWNISIGLCWFVVVVSLYPWEHQWNSFDFLLWEI